MGILDSIGGALSDIAGGIGGVINPADPKSLVGGILHPGSIGQSNVPGLGVLGSTTVNAQGQPTTIAPPPIQQFAPSTGIGANFQDIYNQVPRDPQQVAAQQVAAQQIAAPPSTLLMQQLAGQVKAQNVGAARTGAAQLNPLLINQDRSLQLGARTQQQQAIGGLAQAAAGAVPSAAEIQSRAALGQATQQQLALANSARGGSDQRFAAQRQAQAGIGALQQGAIAQTGALRAQEQATARGQLTGAIGDMRAGDAGMQGADLTGAAQNAGFQQQASLANAGFQQQARLANQGAGLQAQQANAGNLLSAAQADQSAIQRAQLANQGTNLQAQLANQGSGLNAQLANQSAGLQAQALGTQRQLGAAQGVLGAANLDLNALAQYQQQYAGMQGLQLEGQKLQLQQAMANAGNTASLFGGIYNSGGAVAAKAAGLG